MFGKIYVKIYVNTYIRKFLQRTGWQVKWMNYITKSEKQISGTSLVAQWLRTRLPMQGTQVWALVQEDPTCHGATKPVCHNYWACALEPTSHNYWSHHAKSPCSATREATAMIRPCTTRMSSPRSWQLEKAHAQQRRPNAAKDK